MDSPLGVRKGAWTGEEDLLLRKCIDKYGEGEWHQIPIRAGNTVSLCVDSRTSERNACSMCRSKNILFGLNRCRKSCRLRWLNYLRPNIKRGEFTLDEVDLIMRLHKLLGNRWSLIVGRLPGRTANDVKNYWNSRIHKKSFSHQQEMKNKTQKRLLQVNNIIKPRPRTFSKSLPLLRDKFSSIVDNNKLKENICKPSPTPPTLQLDGNQWWESLNVDHASHNIATSFASGIEEETIASLSWAEEIAPMTGVGETFMEDGQSGWSDFSFDMEIWDLL